VVGNRTLGSSRIQVFHAPRPDWQLNVWLSPPNPVTLGKGKPRVSPRECVEVIVIFGNYIQLRDPLLIFVPATSLSDPCTFS